MIVCYVADFSAVCADELSQLVKDFHKFKTRGIKILAMSCDSINSHVKWIEVNIAVCELQANVKYLIQSKYINDLTEIFQV